jgi:hypothetical protein
MGSSLSERVPLTGFEIDDGDDDFSLVYPTRGIQAQRPWLVWRPWLICSAASSALSLVIAVVAIAFALKGNIPAEGNVPRHSQKDSQKEVSRCDGMT